MRGACGYDRGMNRRIFAFVLCAALAPASAQACRSLTPQVPLEQVYGGATSVFLGKLIEIRDGLPPDFQPSDVKEFESRKASLARQGKASVGQTFIFEPIRVWKNPQGNGRLAMVMPAPENTCEFGSQLEVGEEVVVVAGRYGNYPSLPSSVMDPNLMYTMSDPSKRDYPPDYRKTYAKELLEEEKRYTKIIHALEKIKP